MSMASVVPTMGRAQATTERTDTAAVAPYRNQLIALPYVSYSPQTKLLFGAGGRYQFKSPAARAEKGTRPSTLSANAAYTTKGQWGAGFGVSLYLPQNRWSIAGGVGAGFFPVTYYGVGSDTRVSDGTLLDQHFLGTDIRVLRQVTGDFSAGVHYRGASYYGVKFEDPSRITAGLAGATGGVLSGAGVVVQVEARNSTTTPTTGHYLLVDLLRYGGWLGSEFGYTSLAVDARVYLPVRRAGDVIALALYGQWNGSGVPIQAMSMLGGITTQELMRGVYLGRFRDQHELVAQADYRGHLKGRFGYVVYGSAGNVFGSAGRALFDAMKFTYGAGLRFNINPADPLNLRVDYTLTSFGSPGLSLGAAEAF
ncbi:MAG: hypothetical protein ABI587_04150 [Gemmatimonadales bacterium]